MRDDPKILGPVLLDIGIALLRAGAGTGRIKVTMTRITSGTSFEPHIDIHPRSISLTLQDKNHHIVFNGSRSIPSQSINFKIISGMSRLSWSILDKNLTLPEVRNEINRLLGLPEYPRLVILLVVGLAGSAFCYTFGGGFFEMLVAFLATFTGLFLKQQLVKKKFNIYICTFLSALSAALLVGLVHQLDTGFKLEHAFATSVLFLVPGVPLINSFTDLIDGYILNGIERGFNALIHLMAIAFGLTTVLFLFNLY
jgi:uncharacterized membrane protein YjjP (DUF1212 family)